MKTKTKKKPELIIPTCHLITDVGFLSNQLLTESEINVFNTYFYFLDLRKTSDYLKIGQAYCSLLISTALLKLEFIYSQSFLEF